VDDFTAAKIAIVGTGAIGGFYGAMLARAGRDVHFLCRGDYAHAREHGLAVTRVDAADFTLPEARVYPDSRDIGESGLVIIATKATANAELPAILTPLVGPATTLLTLQNGMGNVEFLERHFPDNPILGGLCFVCVNRTAPGVFENSIPGGGTVVIGAHRHAGEADAGAAARLFSGAEVKAKASASLDEALWRKLCWNVPFNGLCIAAGGVSTAVVMESGTLRALARQLMEDVRAGAAAHGHAIEDGFLQKQFEATDGMGPYRPSSLIDYEAGRPVEVEAIFGEPLRRGQAQGALMPRLETLYYLLKAICPAP
jgi:2-dehydropantoate 2-reductase